MSKAIAAATIVLLALLLCGAYITPPVNAQVACDIAARSINTADEATVLALTNQLRVSHGLPPLLVSAALTRAAYTHASWEIRTNQFMHDDIATTVSRFHSCGDNSTAIGENIAGNSADPNVIFALWVNSPEHLANMLSPTFTEVGVAGVDGSAAIHPQWVMELGNGTPLPTPGPAPIPIPQPIPQPQGICYAFGWFGTYDGPCPFGITPHPIPPQCLTSPFPVRQGCM